MKVGDISMVFLAACTFAATPNSISVIDSSRPDRLQVQGIHHKDLNLNPNEHNWHKDELGP